MTPESRSGEDRLMSDSTFRAKSVRGGAAAVAGERVAPDHARRRDTDMDDVEQVLRRLALNDEKLVGSVLSRTTGLSPMPALDRKSEALVHVGALLSVGASTASLRWTVERAQSTGATDEEILGVLVAIGPAVGLARVVAAAPRLALAMGYEIDDDA
jgi:4-carboxymuconolactone decarboxylase